jgi:hypothetical protein
MADTWITRADRRERLSSIKRAAENIEHCALKIYMERDDEVLDEICGLLQSLAQNVGVIAYQMMLDDLNREGDGR